MSEPEVNKNRPALQLLDSTIDTSDGSDSVPIFTLHFDGKVDVDWNKMVEAKNRFLKENSTDSADILAAAIWITKNT